GCGSSSPGAPRGRPRPRLPVPRLPALLRQRALRLLAPRLLAPRPQAPRPLQGPRRPRAPRPPALRPSRRLGQPAPRGRRRSLPASLLLESLLSARSVLRQPFITRFAFASPSVRPLRIPP